MAMPIKVRPSFQFDTAYLERLRQAIELDPKYTDEWKKTVYPMINRLRAALLQAEAERIGANDGNEGTDNTPISE